MDWPNAGEGPCACRFVRKEEFGECEQTEWCARHADERDEITHLRGAQAADDERLATAARRVGIVAGCDAAEWMADEIERLRDENAKWRGLADANARVAEACQRRSEKLRDENAKLREDAERYAFLRDSTCCSLILSRNEDHACNYVTAKQWIEEFGTANDWSDVPPDELQRMKDTNTIWALQIYPNMPVGFNRWSRSTLDAAIDAAMQKGE